MTPRPSCRLCRRPVIRAVTSPGNSPITLNPDPSASGLWAVDFDHAVPIARKLRETRPGLPTLYERHFDTCARLTTDEPAPEAPPGIPLIAQRDALAAALARRTHEFVPGENEDGEPGDLCAAQVPFTCGHVTEHPVHSTPRAILLALAARAER